MNNSILDIRNTWKHSNYQDKLVGRGGYILAIVGEKISIRIPKSAEISGGFLAVTLIEADLTVPAKNQSKYLSRSNESLLLLASHY